VMMSGHATIDAAVRATRLGAFDFLEKPLSTDRLLLVIDNGLRLFRAEAEATALRTQTGQLSELLGRSRTMTVLREQIARAAKATATVLVTGERGTGKELVARAIHTASKRARGPLEKMNCAAVPSELIESEMFGHEAGAFTGATKQRRGKFERASGGTLFLDEVGDMPLTMQAKLLRVLQEREIERVGGHEVLKVDVRVVAATNRDLLTATAEGAFRADLYDRLNVLPLHLPPLRARREDIPELGEHFLQIATTSNDRPGMKMTEGARDALSAYSFPGNVRELRNIIERLVILTPDETIDADDVKNCLGAGAARSGGLYRAGVPFRVLVEEAERNILEEAMGHHQGQMAATARSLGLERSHLYKKCRALGLRGDKPDADEDAS
jgi:DNA-binding NtrC family response regulator